jgi:hypothetical protein
MVIIVTLISKNYFLVSWISAQIVTVQTPSPARPLGHQKSVSYDCRGRDFEGGSERLPQIEQMSMLKTKTICFPYYIKKTV